MLYVKNTPNNAGVTIYGDRLDFKNLYEALHNVVGNEDEFAAYDTARIRVWAICYDIRHALMGDQEIEFVDNGMDANKVKWMGIIAPDKNVYLKINVLWPEMLFITIVLNDFVKLYAKKQTKKRYDMMLYKRNIWDISIIHVRLLQAAVVKCIKKTVSEAVFNRVMDLMNKDCMWFEGYASQYVDVLNCRFLNMNKEKRLKSIPKMGCIRTSFFTTFIASSIWGGSAAQFLIIWWLTVQTGSLILRKDRRSLRQHVSMLNRGTIYDKGIDVRPSAVWGHRRDR